MFPLAPLAGVAGGIMGAALGAAWRLGIKDDFRQRVQDLVQPGTSALMVIVRKTTPEKFTEALRPYGGTVLKTSLPRDAELELMKALRQPGLTHLDPVVGWGPGLSRCASIPRQCKANLAHVGAREKT